MSHLTKLQAALKAANADAIVVSSEVNQRYLTSFAYTDGYVLVTKEKGYLITDFRYIEAAKNECAAGFEILMPQNGMLLTMRDLIGDGKTVCHGAVFTVDRNTRRCVDAEPVVF